MPTLTAPTRAAVPTEPYVAAFEDFLKTDAAKDASWLRALRESAFAHFVEQGFPTTRHEEWKYTSVAPITKLPFKLSSSALSEVEGSSSNQIEDIFSDLSRAHLARYARCDANPFVALNTAFFTDGAVIRIPKGKVVTEPIRLVFAAPESGATVHPRILIIAEENSQASIIEHFVGNGTTPYFTNTVTEIVVGEGATVEHIKIQEESASAFHIATIQAQLARNANFTSHSISLGAKLARNNINLVLASEGIEAILNGLYLAGGDQLMDHHTVADHTAPHCNSHEFYHGILGGRARGVFNGKIFVRQAAQKTDAKQTNRNLLLSKTATVDTKPQLEIFADDVKCTHGATVGQLDENAIFYLRSRGIHEKEARRILTQAFASEIINRIKVESVRNSLGKTIEARLGELVGRVTSHGELDQGNNP